MEVGEKEYSTTAGKKKLLKYDIRTKAGLGSENFARNFNVCLETLSVIKTRQKKV